MKKSHLGFLGLAVIVALTIAVCVIPEARELAYHAVLSPWSVAGLSLAHAVPGAVLVSSQNMRAMQKKKAAVVARMREISAAAGENQFTPEQTKEYGELRAQRDALDTRITDEADLVASEAQLGRATLPDGAIRVDDNREKDAKGGFSGFGEFGRAVVSASAGGRVDQRLIFGDHANDGSFQAAAPSTYGNELAGVDGGFLIPPQFAAEIFTLALGEDSLVPFCDVVELENGNSMVFPKDETTPWGTDGIRMYWQAEASAGTPTKPKLGTLALRLHKMLGLVPVTDELNADARALSGYLAKKLGMSLRWKLNEAIINGTGAGQPQGVMTSAAVTQVSKDSGQAASTLTIYNCANMLAQLPPGSWGSAIWLIHNTVLGSLFTLNVSGIPYYLPFGAGAMQKTPFGTLLGRPIIVSQHAAAFSSAGDVQLHDLQYFQGIAKGGPEMATSMHLYFDADATAFRLTYRFDGKPKIAAAISQAQGSTKLSPFLKLQAR